LCLKLKFSRIDFLTVKTKAELSDKQIIMSRPIRTAFRSATKARSSLSKQILPNLPRATSFRYSSGTSSGDRTGFPDGRRLLTTLAVGGAVLGAALYYADSQGYFKDLFDKRTVATRYANAQELQSAIRELQDAFPEKNRVQTDPDALGTYGDTPHSYHTGRSHAVIVSARSTEDVIKVVNISRKYKVPIVPYASATSLEGHIAGVSSVLKYYIGLELIEVSP
jgi:hypothetical protein